MEILNDFKHVLLVKRTFFWKSKSPGEVRDDMKNVESVHSTVDGAFIATLTDGSLLEWGQPSQHDAAVTAQRGEKRERPG